MGRSMTNTPTIKQTKRRKAALFFAKRGFPIIRLLPASKKPADEWQKSATTDAAIINSWFDQFQDMNYGIVTGHGFFVADLDVKGGGNPLAFLKEQAAKAGATLPETITIRTPSGGWHYFFKGEARNSTHKKSLGGHTDIRGAGGYVVGALSSLPGGDYELVGKTATIAPSPDWLTELAKQRTVVPMTRDASVPLNDPDDVNYVRRILRQLVDDGDVAIEWHGGNDRTYRLFALCMDYCDRDTSLALVTEIWNPECQPPWDDADLEKFADHAEEYRQNEIGAKATGSPEHVFGDAVQKLNAEKPIETTAAEVDVVETVTFKRASDVKTTIQTWVWQNYIPKGEVMILAGNPDCGKSTLFCNFGARLTTGTQWPDGSPCPQGQVMHLTIEDDLSKTVVPRLKAAGADLDKVIFVDPIVQVRGGKRLLDLATDLKQLERKLIEEREAGRPVAAIMIEPLSAYAGPGVKMTNGAEMRRLLSPVADFAHEHSVTVIVLMHLNKAVTAGAPIHRVADSHAITALSRALWMCAPEFDNGQETGRYLFMRGKGNLAEKGAMVPNLAYKIVGVSVDLDDGNTSKLPVIKWDGPVVTTSDEAFEADYRKVSKAHDAERFLDELLSSGNAMLSSDIKEKAAERKIAWRTVEMAKLKLQVKARKRGGKGGPWEWYMEDLNMEEQAEEIAERLKAAEERIAAEAKANANAKIDWANMDFSQPN
jgi:hypothetical protein